MSLSLKSGAFEKILPAVAGGCLLLLCAVYIADARQQAPQRSLPDLTFDPPLGSGEPDRFASVEPGNNLWIYGGECSEYSLNALDPRMIPHQYYDSVIVFYSASEKKFPDFPRPANVLLVSDPAAKLSAKLNPLWIGRWYIYRNSKLAQLQKDPDEPGPWEIKPR